MATAPSHLKGEHYVVTGPYALSVADSVDALLYMPDPSNPPGATPAKLIVAAGNVYCGWLKNNAKVGDHVSLVVTGRGPAKASSTNSGVIAAYALVAVDTGGACRVGVAGTDYIIGFNDGPATTTAGDIFTLAKLA